MGEGEDGKALDLRRGDGEIISHERTLLPRFFGAGKTKEKRIFTKSWITKLWEGEK